MCKSALRNLNIEKLGPGFSISFLREIRGVAGALSCPAGEWEPPPYAKPGGRALPLRRSDTGTLLVMTVKHRVSHAVMDGMETREKCQNPKLGLSGRRSSVFEVPHA